MAKFPGVMPHHDLVPIFDDAWYLQGSVSFKPMIVLVRNMVVLRHDGELTLINAIRLNDAGEAALAALGEVVNVVQIGGHGMDNAYYADKYAAKMWGVPGVVPDGGHEMSAEDLPHPGLTLFLFQDTRQPEAALLLNTGGGLLITCDSVQHWVPSDLMSFVARMVTAKMGFQHPAQIGPPWRKKMTPEGGSLKPDFERLLELPFTHLIGGHGGLARDNANELLKATIARTFPD
jgi:hypothetical protein